jgi:hypothetical protein
MCGSTKPVTNSSQGVRSFMRQSRIFVGMVLILIFAEVLGLYGYVWRHHGRFADLNCSC